MMFYLVLVNLYCNSVDYNSNLYSGYILNEMV